MKKAEKIIIIFTRQQHSDLQNRNSFTRTKTLFLNFEFYFGASLIFNEKSTCVESWGATRKTNEKKTMLKSTQESSQTASLPPPHLRERAHRNHVDTVDHVITRFAIEKQNNRFMIHKWHQTIYIYVYIKPVSAVIPPLASINTELLIFMKNKFIKV